MQLSLRLAAISKMVHSGNRLVDVGCDHGYLPVYLVLNKKIPSAIAMDVRKGPLLRAKEHVQQYRVSDYIELRLSDGLSALKAGEGDTLVIAGMGGPLMERILTEGRLVLDSFQELILQPQSDIGHFRHFIRKQGWEIREEEMIVEDGKFYPMMRVTKSTEGYVPWTKEEEAFGRLLLEARHPVLQLYLQRELRIREQILEKLIQAGEGARERKAEVEEEQRLLMAALTRYESM